MDRWELESVDTTVAVSDVLRNEVSPNETPTPKCHHPDTSTHKTPKKFKLNTTVVQILMTS